MGGWGSGRPDFRPHIEDALAIDLASINQHNKVKANSEGAGYYNWYRQGVRFSRIAYHWETDSTSGVFRLAYVDNGNEKLLEFHLMTTEPHFGGRRWWFRCPVTRRRVRKIYKFAGRTSFCSIHSLDLKPTYQSQRTPMGIERVWNKRRLVRSRLGSFDENLLAPFRKPANVHWHTYIRAYHLDEELKRQEMGLTPKWLLPD